MTAAVKNSPCRFLVKDKKLQVNTNRYGPSAEKLRAEAEVQVEEVEAAVTSLRKAIVAFEAAETKASTKATTTAPIQMQ